MSTFDFYRVHQGPGRRDRSGVFFVNESSGEGDFRNSIRNAKHGRRKAEVKGGGTPARKEVTRH